MIRWSHESHLSNFKCQRKSKVQMPKRKMDLILFTLIHLRRCVPFELCHLTFGLHLNFDLWHLAFYNFFQGFFGCFLLGLFFALSPSDSLNFPVDDRRGLKSFIVVRSGFLQHSILRRDPMRLLGMYLKKALIVVKKNRRSFRFADKVRNGVG